MFTLGNWIIISIFFIVGLGISFYIWWDKRCEKKRAITLIISLLITIAVTGAVVGGFAIYNTHTESGKRAVKTWESEKSGGLNRIVHVYDMEGDEIATYKGKFDIEENTTEGIVKVKFDMDGERHIIYGSTGTIVIDEIPEEKGE